MLVVNWQSCIDKLKDELPLQQFNTWIRPLKIEADQQSVTLIAPNRFVKDWVEEKYRKRIEQLLINESGRENVSFTITDRKSDLVELENLLQNESKERGADRVPEAIRKKQQSESPHGMRAGNESLETAGQEKLAAPTVESQNLPKPEEITKAPINQSVIAGKLSHKSRLNRVSTFDNFIVGKSNQLARAAATQVAENPGKAYNPLFIYGGVGLGKTHLMHAIGNFMLKRKPDAKIVYLHSETFVATMVTALQLNAINEFKRFYRS
ncbi:MAG: chromosomal replication initiator protein DnaA, partial [Gammaproteobacteria bacterium]|nr:chromosomal replication initiator protein DnaA [Gammaproteobacteria bacterium]